MAAARVVRLFSRRILTGSSNIESISWLRSTKSRVKFCTSASASALQNPRFRVAESDVKTPKETRVSSIQEEALTHADYFQVNELFTMRDLFNAGVHYGHHEGCWNPLMKPYLRGSREHIHIIDLNETVTHLTLALNVISHVVYRGGSVLFVCTHPQFEELTQKLARDTEQHFVTRRWRGGTLTNSNMVLGTRRLPDVVVFLHLPSLGRNTLAVKETAMCNIPSIGIVDSDCNPNLITYPIPGNDDSPSAMVLYSKVFKEAVLKAKEKRNLLQYSKKQKRDQYDDASDGDFY